MNWDQIEGKWSQVKGEVQAQWGRLTDDDVAEADGNREKLAGKIQERYGKAKEDVETEIDAWLAKH